jgi:hypothetical protein
MSTDLQKEVERLRIELAASKWRERMWKKAAKSWMADADALKAKYEPLVLDLCLETPPESGAELRKVMHGDSSMSEHKSGACNTTSDTNLCDTQKARFTTTATIGEIRNGKPLPDEAQNSPTEASTKRVDPIHEAVCKAAGWPTYCKKCGGPMRRFRGMSVCDRGCVTMGPLPEYWRSEDGE